MNLKGLICNFESSPTKDVALFHIVLTSLYAHSHTFPVIELLNFFMSVYIDKTWQESFNLYAKIQETLLSFT